MVHSGYGFTLIWSQTMALNVTSRGPYRRADRRNMFGDRDIRPFSGLAYDLIWLDADVRRLIARLCHGHSSVVDIWDQGPDNSTIRDALPPNGDKTCLIRHRIQHTQLKVKDMAHACL